MGLWNYWKRNMGINLHNRDCMLALKEFKDNQFELAIVDPPYGIDIIKNGNVGGSNAAKHKEYKIKDWDKKTPDTKYFIELQRVSKNQIMFGANYYISKIKNCNSRCWIVWDKDNTGNFADCELAWTSFNTSVRKFKWRWNGMIQQNMKNKEIKIHPTQKPVKLYEWLLMNYAKEGGSGSIAIACHNLGFDLEGYELDTEYFEAATKRLKQHTKQQRLF